ncbi:Cytochrome c-type biogenesis protein CcmG/DsbE, thiol:disulfide oxidoreductase [hydrothermal vent metagenome]|uniref:Cytochrome c-type biogenesis protein CcmG/DsbE, thiol:disulfide oxidoreductase n=1 Tax=hydrothermal vent metagenome TaxID=652676 RepID=A0A3B1B255_9ZZZZ
MPLKRFLPLFIFAGILIAFMIGLSLKPSEIPSGLINKPVPDFSLPPLQGDGIGLSTADLIDPENIVIVNFFASWCGPCRVEHPALELLGKLDGVKLHGIAYKDRPKNSLSFLKSLGNPYDKIGTDLKGRVAIDWGVTGTPETFIIKNGIIRYQHIGPIHQMQVDDLILPIIKNLQQEDAS